MIYVKKGPIRTKIITFTAMKRLFSYLFPFALKKYKSKISGVLKINLLDKKKILYTANSNYSYGSLQKFLHHSLEKINFNAAIHLSMDGLLLKKYKSLTI